MKRMHTPNFAAIGQVSDADKWLIDRPHAQLFPLWPVQWYSSYQMLNGGLMGSAHVPTISVLTKVSDGDRWSDG